MRTKTKWRFRLWYWENRQEIVSVLFSLVGGAFFGLAFWLVAVVMFNI